MAERAAFHHSTASGKVAVEIEPHGKAAQEISDVWKWICKRVNMPARKPANKQTHKKEVALV